VPAGLYYDQRLLTLRRGKPVPLTVAGITVWYDGADPSTWFQDPARTTPASANGDVVGGLRDKSGLGNHASQATVAKKPTLALATQNGLAALQGDGTDDGLVVPDAAWPAGERSMFIVASYGGASGYSYSWGRNAAIAGSLGITRDGGAGWSDSLVNASLNHVYGAGWRVESWIFQTEPHGATHVWKNAGSPYASAYGFTLAAGTNNSPGIFGRANGVGSFDNCMAGYIGEVIAYSRALATAERQTIETYLRGKWGL
jgi:hypothetical protein